MSNIQSLKRRIKSAKNIKQITKAMEMVAASKMRRAQTQALSSRPYARKLQQSLTTIASLTTEEYAHPLLSNHSIGDDVFLIFSTDKSLAGSLNTNLFRGAYSYITQESTTTPKCITIGQKARSFIHSSGFELIAEYTDIPDPLSYADSLPISANIINAFSDQRYKSVHIVYMDFISTLVQKVRPFKLLPLSTDWTSVIEDPKEALEETLSERAEYIFEPNASDILDWLLPYYVELSIYQIMLESKASEHSARMVSMKNASENATDIISDLTLSYNKVRQAGITAELLDNTTASMIVK